MNQSVYEERYRQDPNYWGGEPTTIAKEFVSRVLPELKRGTFPPVCIVDIGCGEGRDALYYAEQGVHVTAVDKSESGIEALRTKAKTAGRRFEASIDTCVADITEFRLDRTYDAIVSSGALHYIPTERRNEILTHYKEMVRPGGVIAATVILQKPFIDAAPDEEPNVTLFRSGEIMQYLWDWEVLWVLEEIRPCNSSGVPHRHAFDRVIARKPQ